MADLRISQLNTLNGADLAAADLLVAVDDSASETKKLTVGDLISNGVTLIADDTIPGAKILFAAGGIATADLANSAVNTVKLADNSVTAAKLADESTVDLVTTLPATGAFTGQLALDTDDNFLYVWNGSVWVSLKAPGSINTVSGDTSGTINITTSTSGSTVTVSATIDDTAVANQFLAGPTGAGGTAAYRVIDSTDLPTSSTTAKGAVLVNGEGLRMDGDTIEVDNDVTDTTTHHVVTYSAKGLITGGRTLTSADLPLATSTAAGAIIPGDGLAVDVNGNLSIDNTVATGTYTKVTVTAEGVVSTGDTLGADDIPDHSAAKLTSGTIISSLIGSGTVTAAKLADESTTQFGGAVGSDNVTVFPAGDFKGQFFYDETTQDLYIYTGSAFVPITVLSGNLVNAGAYNASTNLMSSVTTAGSSAGFSAGSALPAPAGVNLNHYVVVDTSGTGSGAAPAVALAPPDMLLSQGVGTEYSLIDVSNAIAGQTASNISLIAAGDITATNVQAGIQELDTEKLPKAGGTMTGNLSLDNASVVFEGSTVDDYKTFLTVTDPTAVRIVNLPDVTGTVITTGDTGTISSTMIADGTIVNADISASAEIAVSKLANGGARQLLQTDAAGTGVEFTSNVDIPGTLDVTGAVTFDSTVIIAGQLSANGKLSFTTNSSAATPAIYPGTDTNTGIFSPGTDQIAIATNGTGRLFVNASGSLLLNASSPYPVEGFNRSHYFCPGQGLSNNHVVLSAMGANGFPAIYFTKTRGSTPTTQTIVQNGDNLGSLRFFGSDGSDYDNSSAEINCNVDGTPGASDIPGRLVFSTTTSGGFSPTEKMRIGSNGNVGIGTSAPAQKLHVSGTGFTAVQITGDSTNETQLWFTANTAARISNRENTALLFDTNASERMRLDSSGRLLIGTSSVVDVTTGTEQGFTSAGYLTEVSRNDAVPFRLRRRVSDGSIQDFYRDTTFKGSISVTTTGAFFNSVSDYRLKENVVDLDGAINRVKQLAPKRFNFIADADTTVDGFLAHEAQAVVPEAVIGTHDEVDDDGNAVMQGIDQSRLVPLLTAALKEAIAKIETLETKVAALEAAN